ncbi:MAG: glycosyltransferase [Chloroflexota bacterium]
MMFLKRNEQISRDDIRSQIQQIQQPNVALPDWMKQVTFIAPTFERPGCILNLLKSIRAYYPAIPVLVCDSSQRPLFDDENHLPNGISWFTLPYEKGHTLGAARNHLVTQVKTKYFFLCDDDHVINQHTDLGRMFRFLEAEAYDIVGGCQDKNDYGTAIFEQIGDIVYQRFFEHHGEIRPGVVRCDRVSNTFLARTAAVNQVPWEDRVYGSEHAEFFLRATWHGLKIAQMNQTYVDHKRDCEHTSGVIGHLFGRFLPHRDRHYQKLRDGGEKLLGLSSKQLEQKYCWEKNGIQKIISTQSQQSKQKFMALMSVARPKEKQNAKIQS